LSVAGVKRRQKIHQRRQQEGAGEEVPAPEQARLAANQFAIRYADRFAVLSV
jgi:hypothetical protein